MCVRRPEKGIVTSSAGVRTLRLRTRLITFRCYGKAMNVPFFGHLRRMLCSLKRMIQRSPQCLRTIFERRSSEYSDIVNTVLRQIIIRHESSRAKASMKYAFAVCLPTCL